MSGGKSDDGLCTLPRACRAVFSKREDVRACLHVSINGIQAWEAAESHPSPHTYFVCVHVCMWVHSFLQGFPAWRGEVVVKTGHEENDKTKEGV